MDTVGELALLLGVAMFATGLGSALRARKLRRDAGEPPLSVAAWLRQPVREAPDVYARFLLIALGALLVGAVLAEAWLR